jgi:hypothetical protein
MLSTAFCVECVCFMCVCIIFLYGRNGMFVLFCFIGLGMDNKISDSKNE